MRNCLIYLSIAKYIYLHILVAVKRDFLKTLAITAGVPRY